MTRLEDPDPNGSRRFLHEVELGARGKTVNLGFPGLLPPFVVLLEVNSVDQTTHLCYGTFVSLFSLHRRQGHRQGGVGVGGGS